MEKITSVNNEKIKNAVKLKDRTFRREHQQYLIEGYHLIHEALKKEKVLTIFGTQKGLTKLWIPEPKEYETYEITDNVAKKMSDTVKTQEVFAICVIKKPTIDYTQNILLLDQVQDPGNIGTLIRSAASFNFPTVIASPNSVSFHNAKVLRATQGNFFSVNLVNDHLIKTINDLKDADYLIVGTSLHNTHTKTLQKTRFSRNQKYALIIGNEAKGITAQLDDLIDFNINVEMDNNIESLNAAVAGSIIMYAINIKKES